MRFRTGFLVVSLLLLSALAMGCTTGAVEPGYSPGSTAVLQPGEALALPGGARLRYVERVSDSRCPPGVQCIRAGEAQVRFELDTGMGEPDTRVLTLPGRSTETLGGWHVELLELESGAQAAATVRVLAAER